MGDVKMTRALYPGTFDPIHVGHLDVIARAAAIFEELIVGVSAGASVKTPLFSTEALVDLVRRVVAHLPNVTVATYSGLTVLFAR
jgi:pantetheine-phosphate adenylyltransferase